MEGQAKTERQVERQLAAMCDVIERLHDRLVS